MISVALTRPSASIVRRARTRPPRMPARNASRGKTGIVRLVMRNGAAIAGDGGTALPGAATRTRSLYSGDLLVGGTMALAAVRSVAPAPGTSPPERLASCSVIVVGGAAAARGASA